MDQGALVDQESVSLNFNIEIDPIPSFGALLLERAKVFSSRQVLESFTRQVAQLESSAEAGRRRGLGMWMVGNFEEAIQLLSVYHDDDVAAFTMANALVSNKKPADAVPIFKRLAEKYPEEPRPWGGWLDAQTDADLAASGVDAAQSNLVAVLCEAPQSLTQSAEGYYLTGRVAELSNEPQAALDAYSAARDADPTHRKNLFRLAYVAERGGLEELALECYETLCSMLPIDRNALINLGVLYEDLGRDQEAAAAYDTIVTCRRADPQARLYLEDAQAGMNMFYDEDLEKKEDRLNQILRIPITDFELSVRARNCLNKMDIMTLGDLVKKSEAELLSYKNFGETSLIEIKEILSSKNLRLGMAREEAVLSIAKLNETPPEPLDANDPGNKPLTELKLSIRARRTVEHMGCITLNDITQHTEEELLGMPNFGVTSLIELKEKLAEYGLRIKGDDK